MKTGYLAKDNYTPMVENPVPVEERVALKREIAALKVELIAVKSDLSEAYVKSNERARAMVESAEKVLQNAKDEDARVSLRLASLVSREEKLEAEREEFRRLSNLNEEAIGNTITGLNTREDVLNDRENALDLVEKTLTFRITDVEIADKDLKVAVKAHEDKVADYFKRLEALQERETAVVTETLRLDNEKQVVVAQFLALGERESLANDAIANAKMSEARADKAVIDMSSKSKEYFEHITILKGKIKQADERLENVRLEEARIGQEKSKLEELRKYIVKEGA